MGIRERITKWSGSSKGLYGHLSRRILAYPLRAAFLEKLPEGVHILDAGCVCGRDSLYFKKLSYKITAMEPAIELCKLASEHIGQEVLALKWRKCG